MRKSIVKSSFYQFLKSGELTLDNKMNSRESSRVIQEVDFVFNLLIGRVIFLTVTDKNAFIVTQKKKHFQKIFKK